MPALVAALAGAALMALAMLFWVVLDAIDARVNSPADNLIWGTAQAEREYNLLRLSLDEAIARPDESGVADLQLRLDLFVSRLRILEQGTFYRQLAEEPHLLPILEHVQTIVAQADAVMAGASGRPVAAVAEELRTVVEPLGEDLRRLAVEGNHLYGQREVEDREVIRRLILAIAAVFATLAGIVICFLVTLAMQQRRLQDTNEALSQLSEDLREADQTKSRFLANMSHELRTPLNAVLGFSEVMQDQRLGPMPERYQGYAEDIHRSAAHLLDLINHVLDLSKVEAGRREVDLEPLDLHDEIATAIRLTKVRAHARKIEVELLAEAALPPVLADRLALRQVLLNLLSNAVKFSRVESRVEIRVGRDGDVLRIAVADRGIGIAEKDLPRIAQPFEQVRSAFTAADEGTGLGLALSKGLVELMHGRLLIESALGVGTTVTVTLPLAPEDALCPPPPELRRVAN